MKLYVASSWRNPDQPAAVQKLREAGYDAYDFRNPSPGDQGFAWSEIDPLWQGWSTSEFRDALGSPIAARGFGKDMQALRACDACVLLLPCGRSAHLEAGWAAGAGKPVIVVLSLPFEPELMYLACTSVCINLEAAIEALGELSGAKP